MDLNAILPFKTLLQFNLLWPP